MYTLLKILIIKPLLLYPILVLGQDKSISDSVKNLCDQIAKDSILESEYIGSMGLPSKQWKRFNCLKSIANDSIFLELVNHSSPTVRAYAFLGLMHKNPSLFMKALRENEQDTVYVKFLNGCIGGSEQVYFYALKNGYHYLNKNTSKKLNHQDYIYLENNYLIYEEKLMQRYKSRR